MFFLPTPERMDSGDSNVLPGSSVADYVVGDDEMPDGASKTSTAPTALKAPQGGAQLRHKAKKPSAFAVKAAGERGRGCIFPHRFRLYRGTGAGNVTPGRPAGRGRRRRGIYAVGVARTWGARRPAPSCCPTKCPKRHTVPEMSHAWGGSAPRGSCYASWRGMRGSPT